MIAEEFRKLWKTDEHDNWVDLDVGEINKAPLNNLTKDFLKNGFPESAAPCLDFGWRSYKGKFYNIDEVYPKLVDHNLAKNYWIIGSDGAGNPICFDVLRNDRIVLLDHEQRFETIEVINSDIFELGKCLLLYRNFISEIQRKYGENAFLDSLFSISDISELKDNFKTINENIFKESGFWRSEIKALEDEIR
jgi:hypothetical protein